VLKVLEVTEEWEQAERRLIAEARERGERLLNLADGGDQPQTTPDQLQRCFSGMMAKRPPNVMRVYRSMEAAIRHSQKY
ncbi:hypothetical protein U2065_14910, partial [Listeria monocytogenes]|uniref:hypothetical protein n=1 Tax=Listeria monocytogenes TaxID=1639 RepID=UPI002FDBF389